MVLLLLFLANTREISASSLLMFIIHTVGRRCVASHQQLSAVNNDSRTYLLNSFKFD